MQLGRLLAALAWMLYNAAYRRVPAVRVLLRREGEVNRAPLASLLLLLLLLVLKALLLLFCCCQLLL